MRDPVPVQVQRRERPDLRDMATPPRCESVFRRLLADQQLRVALARCSRLVVRTRALVQRAAFRAVGKHGA